MLFLRLRKILLYKQKKVKKAYLKVLEALSNYNVIIATHCPLDNWSERDYNSNFIYLSGHTHHNIFHMSSDKTVFTQTIRLDILVMITI